MIRMRTIETIAGKHFDVAFQSQVVKPSSRYDPSELRLLLKRRIKLAREGRIQGATTMTELFDAIRKLGVDPQEYAASEPVTLAMAISHLENGRWVIRSHPIFEELMNVLNLSLEDYLPRWEEPRLVWYIFDSSGSLHLLREKRVTVR